MTEQKYKDNQKEIQEVFLLALGNTALQELLRTNLGEKMLLRPIMNFRNFSGAFSTKKMFTIAEIN